MKLPVSEYLGKDIEHLPESLDIYGVLDCEIENYSFNTQLRAEEKNKIATSKELNRLHGKQLLWITDCLIGERLADRTWGKASLEFTVVFLYHFADYYTLYMALQLKSTSPHTRLDDQSLCI